MLALYIPMISFMIIQGMVKKKILLSVGLVLFNIVVNRTGGTWESMLHLYLTKYSTGAGILGSHPTLEWDVYFCKKHGSYKDWKLVSMYTGADWTCEALCAPSLAALSGSRLGGGVLSALLGTRVAIVVPFAMIRYTSFRLALG